MSTVLHSSAPTISETLAPTPYPDLPASLDTDALLNDFLNWQSSLFARATAHKITIDQLIAWWRSDQTQSKVKAIQEMADARKTILAQLHAAAAIDRLAELVENTREVSPLNAAVPPPSS